MWHWNLTQPGGQGTLTDFDSYYALLKDTDKEACPRFDCILLAEALKLP